MPVKTDIYLVSIRMRNIENLELLSVPRVTYVHGFQFMKVVWLYVWLPIGMVRYGMVGCLHKMGRVMLRECSRVCIKAIVQITLHDNCDI